MRHTTAALLLTAAAALTLAACSSSGSALPDVTRTATPAASAPASSTDPAQAIRDWYDQGGSASVDTIKADMGKVQKDLGAQDFTALTDSCGKLAADTETLLASKPMPDPQAAGEWKLAMDHLKVGAQQCTTGAAAQDVEEITQMTAELSIGINHLNAVNKRLDALGVS